MFQNYNDHTSVVMHATVDMAHLLHTTEFVILMIIIVITSCGAKAQQTPPRVAHCSIARLLELTKNVIRSSHGHSTPSLKISCKSVPPFSRNLADKETKKERKKERKKEIDRKQYPVPDSINRGRGNNNKCLKL